MDENPLARLIAELRRRSVFRVAAAYLVVAWAVVEVADTTFPYLGLPARGVTLIIAVAALMLPLALVAAWAYELTPDGVRRDSAVRAEADAAGETGGATARRRRSPWVLAAVIAVAAAIGGLAMWHEADIDVQDHALHPGTVAVLPFRVAGASPELAHLGEGLVDLMSITLTGEVGPRALDPRAVLSTWSAVEGVVTPAEEAIEEVGRRLGAGRLILGEVVGDRRRLTVSASLVETATGEERARARVEGPLDSLPAVVDGLTAELISLDRGEERHRLESLSSTSLPALMKYLEGRRAYRDADYEQALRHYGAALEEDTTFALSALGFLAAAGWTVNPPGGPTERARGLAWRHRDRLSERDRSYLVGMLGPEYPAPSSQKSLIEAWEKAASESPGRPEAWYSLGDRYYHSGPLVEVPDWSTRAGAAFQRALALDSTWNAPLQHLLDLAFEQGDPAEVQRLATLYLARDTAGLWPEYVRYQRAQVLHDTATAERAVESMLRSPAARSAVVFMSSTGDLHRLVKPAAGSEALAAMEKDAATTERLREVFRLRHDHALNRGWPDTAAAALDALRRLDPADHGPLRTAVTDGLYWDGRADRAESAARELERALAGERPDRGPALERWRRDVCVLGQWRASHEDGDGARDAARQLWRIGLEREADGFRSERGLWHDEICATLVSVMAAAADGRRGDVATFADRLDGLLVEGPPVGELVQQGNYVLMGVREEQERLEDAIRVSRRWLRMPGNESYQSTFTRERARLLARAARTEEARYEIQRYLALRRAASPALQDDLDRARDLLARLAGEG